MRHLISFAPSYRPRTGFVPPSFRHGLPTHKACAPRVATKTLSRALSTSSQPAAVTAPSQGLRSADYIVAVVNAEPVTNNEVRARMQRVLQAMQAQGAKRNSSPR